MKKESIHQGLSAEETARYGRHLVMPEIGVAGQHKLREASVVIVGMGGLGSPAALYLAAAGIGKLGLVDFDKVEVSNLQRQILFDTGSLGQSKAKSAGKKVSALNPGVNVVIHDVRLTSENALEVLRAYDVILDCSDRFAVRYLVNDAAVLLGKPNVYGSVYRFEGQTTVFDASRGPCYRCWYPEPPPPELAPNCAEGGVLGVLPGIIGTLQASEAIKLILGIGEPLLGRIVMIDALQGKTQEIRLKKNPRCAVCGEQPTVTALIDYEEFCNSGPKETADTISVEELNSRMKNAEKVFLLDVRQPYEFDIANLGGHLIPLQELSRRLGELDPGKEIVAYCHTGVRSARAVAMLRASGFTKARNLVGGIDAWSVRIDNSVPRY